ncbi:MAG: tripartite tricarboxylate transporter TctB family protein [Rubrivivax sp.]
MKIKSERDFWSGLMFIVVGVGFAVGALNYSFGGACATEAGRAGRGVLECWRLSSARPGPAYFPFGLGVLTALLGAALLFKSLTLETEGGDRIGAWAWKPLLLIVAAVAAFGWLLPHLGMVIALPLLVIVSALAGDEFHWKDALVNAAVLTIGSWAIFVWGLNLVIPLWPAFVR